MEDTDTGAGAVHGGEPLEGAASLGSILCRFGAGVSGRAGVGAGWTVPSCAGCLSGCGRLQSRQNAANMGHGRIVGMRFGGMLVAGVGVALDRGPGNSFID